MRKLAWLVIIGLVFAFSVSGFAQTNAVSTNETGVVAQVSKYAGLGKEIGIILKETVQTFDQGITVTEDHVYKFLNTGVGKTTMAIIVWKVLGKDILGIIFGTILLIMCIVWSYWWFKSLMFGRLVVVGREGKVKKYEYVKPVTSGTNEETGVPLIVIAFLGTIVLFISSMTCIF